LIYVIDFYRRNDFGHFWTQDGYLRRALFEENIPFLFLNPDAISASEEDRRISSVNQIGNYEDLRNKEFSVGNIVNFLAEDANKRNLNTIDIIFTWLPQLTGEDLKLFEVLAQSRTVRIAGISPLSASAVLGDETKHRYYFEEEFEKIALERCLWVWDDVSSYSEAKSFIRRLPEFQSFLRSDRQVNQIRSISFFGMLSPFRGVAEALLIGLFNPKLEVYIRGHGFVPWRAWRPFKKRAFRYQNWKDKPLVSIFAIIASLLISGLRFLPNIHFVNQSFSTESDLDIAISKANTIFYAAKLPLSSGIALKALASGVPVIWFGESGEAVNFLLKNSGEGRIRYNEIFIHNRIYKKVSKLAKFSPNEVFTWEQYKTEVSAFCRT